MEKHANKKHISKFVAVGLLGIASAVSITAVGFSSWVVTDNLAVVSGFTPDAGSVTDLPSDYLYKNALTATENLQYNDHGLVYADDIGTVGHVIFHLIFEPFKYLTAFGKTSSSVSFDFSFGYKEFKTGYTLIDNYATCSTKIWDRNNTVYWADGTALALTKANHVASCGTSSNPLSVSSLSVPVYITLDYKFDVGTNFSTVQTNELANSVVFSLSGKVSGN